MPRLQKLSVCNVQGIPVEKSLVMDGDSLLLYGENGTGKSSFIGAIELLLTGDIARVPRVGPGFNQRIRNRAHREKSCSVSVELKPDGSAKRTDGQAPALAGTGAAWVSQMNARRPILARRDLLNFIAGSPKDRYTVVSRWIGHSEIDSAFLNLKEAAQLAASSRDGAALAMNAREAKAIAALGIPAIPASFEAVAQAVRPALEEASTSIPSSPSDAVVLADGLLSKLAPALGADVLGVRERLKAWAITVPAEIEQAREALAAAKTQLEQLRAQHEAGAAELERVLSSAIDYFQSTGAGVCPVCERGDLREELQGRLIERRAAVQAFATAAQALDTSRARLRELTARERQGWPEHLPSMAAAEAPYMAARQLVMARLDGIDSEHALPPWVPTPELAAVIEAVGKQETILQSGEQAARKIAHRVLSELAAWKELVDARNLLAQRTKIADAAAAIYAAAQQARHELFNARLDAIVARVEAFYKAVHPHEGVDRIQLLLPPPTPAGRRDEQAEIRFKFENQDPEDPRVHLSDGHLDTLGLAFFLMNIAREAEEGGDDLPVLVLDDVITSVDAPHRLRVARELFKQFRGWQLLITTHDRVWLDKVAAIAELEGHPLATKVIRWWSHAEGPELRDYEDLYTSLARRLSGKDTAQSIAANAGVLLERLCDDVRKRFSLEVKSRPDDRYTLMDVFPKMKSLLKKGPESPKALLPGWYDANQELMDSLDVLLAGRENIRNVVGAHWSVMALEFSETDAETFGKGALALYDAFHCNAGGCGRPVFPVDEAPPAARCKCGARSYPEPAPPPGAAVPEAAP